MENNEVSFEQVRRALEIASRIENLRDFLHNEMLHDLSHQEGAQRAVWVQNAERYAKAEKLNEILYDIVNTDREFRPAKFFGDHYTLW